MKKTKIWALAAPLLLIACTARTSPEDVAGAAAKTYYQQLAKGQYAEYVDGFYCPDSIPTNYRQQLIENAKMLLAEQTRERGSLAGVHLTRATVDTALHTANAFLLLTFADSSREEIVVPMVQHRGLWYMR